MRGLAIVRGAGKRQFFIAEAKRIGRTAFDQFLMLNSSSAKYAYVRLNPTAVDALILSVPPTTGSR